MPRCHMCERAKVWRAPWVRARIQHRCGSVDCREQIAPGDLYIKWSGLWDYTWGNGKQCARCHAIMSFLQDQSDGCIVLDFSEDDRDEGIEHHEEVRDMMAWTREECQAHATEQADAAAERLARTRANHERYLATTELIRENLRGAP